jgi:F0F1-type ATP synthase membrane subunit b/b'
VVSTKIQKALIIITLTASVAGLSLSGKPSIFFLWLGTTTGGIYLAASPKPWNQQQRWKNKVSLMRGKISHAKKLIKYNLSIEEMEAKITSSRSDAIAIVENARFAAETELRSARCKIEANYNGSILKLEQLEQIKKQLTVEVNELKKLATEITNNTEDEAKAIALLIKQQAIDESRHIIEATKSNLQNTVFEPERIAHLQLLSQVNLERESAIAEIERLTNLQEKTRIAIEKMKTAAQAEHSRIKEALKKQAQQQFLKEMERVNEMLEVAENQIRLLTTENQMLRGELDSIDEPQYPEGWREHEIYARGIIDFYKQMGIKLDYKLSFREGDRIVVRVVPREEKVGEQQLRKFHDRLQRKFDLSQLPNIVTAAGTIQFELKLLELQNPVIEVYDKFQAPVAQLPYNQPQLHPELVDIEQVRSHLEVTHTREFIPPNTRFSPFEKLTQLERDWVLWLWNTCRIQDQNLVLNTVWRNTRGRGVSQGVGQSYTAARSKLHQILDEAGIPRRKNNNETNE